MQWVEWQVGACCRPPACGRQVRHHPSGLSWPCCAEARLFGSSRGLGGLFHWFWAKAKGGPVSWVRFGAFVVINGHQAAFGPPVPGLMQSQSGAEGQCKDHRQGQAKRAVNIDSLVSLRPPVDGSRVVVGQPSLVAASMCHASDRRCMPCFGVAVARSKI